VAWAVAPGSQERLEVELVEVLAVLQVRNLLQPPRLRGRTAALGTATTCGVSPIRTLNVTTTGWLPEAVSRYTR